MRNKKTVKRIVNIRLSKKIRKINEANNIVLKVLKDTNLMFQALKPTSARTEERVNEVIRNKTATKIIVTTRLSKRIRKTEQVINIVT